MEKEITVGLVGIGKLENDYVREWVEHYFSIGVDRIYLYDNNDIYGEHFEEVIGDYVSDGKVVIIDYRGKINCQVNAYNDFITNYAKQFTWYCVFDCDEFLMLNVDKDIKQFLSRTQFDNCDVIRVNWKCFDDNDLLGNEEPKDRRLVERFTRPIDNSIMNFRFNIPYNAWCKSIVKYNENKNISFLRNSHCPEGEGIIYVNELGEEQTPDNVTLQYPITHKYVQLNHYSTKTITEFVERRVKRGYRHNYENLNCLNMQQFWDVNNKTKEKEEILNSCVRVQYDSLAFDMQTHGGITRYFTELYKGINKIDNASSFITTVKTNNDYLRDLGFEYGDADFNENIDFSLKKLNGDTINVFHSTFYTSNYFLDTIRKKNIPFVMTIHDMIPEIYNWGENNVQVANKKIQAPIADAIVVPSENTKKDVCNILQIPSEKIHVIHHGYNPIKNDKYTNIIGDKYILFVGTRILYKKWSELLWAFKLVSSKYKNIKLVCTGYEFNEYEKEQIKNFELEDKVIHKYVSDEDLRNLYHYAELFVYPSEYEGFGLPILEAYNESCQTLLYNGHCFPEIAKDGATYFDSYNTMSEKIEEVLNMSKTKKNKLIKRQKEILKEYSWEKSVDEHLKVYKQIIEESKKPDITKSRVHFITFANTDSNFSLDRISYEAKNSKYFDTITTYTEKDFDDEYKKLFAGRENDKRGYGYWSWKSYFIKKKLSEIPDNDILFYSDCGCSIIPNQELTYFKWIKQCADSDKVNILSPCYGPYLEKNWNKRSILEYIENIYNDKKGNLVNEIQCGSTVLIIMKTDKTVDFIDKFYDICNNHYDLCTDEPCENESPDFVENRYDQSAFSLLSHVYPIEYVKTEDGILNKETSPIYASRHKNDKTSWVNPNTIKKKVDDDIDIFIYSHVDFKPIVSNRSYKILGNRDMTITDSNGLRILYEDDFLDNISDMGIVYSELCGIYSIWKNYRIKDYIGFCGYRKYFRSKDDIDEMKGFVKKYGILTNSTELSQTVYEQYDKFHNIEDLEEICNIIAEKYPSYKKSVEKTLNEKTLYACNTYIMTKDNFNKWCDFLFTILDEFNKRHHFTKQDDFFRYTKTFKWVTDTNLKYQSRIPGFLSERIFTIWINRNFDSVPYTSIIMLDKK